METLIIRDEMSFGATIGTSRWEEVALDRKIEYTSASFSWQSGSVDEIRQVDGQRLAYWKNILNGKSRKRRDENIEIRQVSEGELKSRFIKNIRSVIKNHGDVDIEAVKRLFTNKEIRLNFPELSAVIPTQEEEIIQSSNNKLMSEIGSGLRSNDLLTAMANFNKAKAAGRYILPFIEPPQKLLIKQFISLAEGLVIFCQGLIENEKIYFEEMMKKMDEFVDIIPSVHYPLKLILRSLLTEDEQERRIKLKDARKISIEVGSKGVSPLERDLTTFFIKFVEV